MEAGYDTEGEISPFDLDIVENDEDEEALPCIENNDDAMNNDSEELAT